MLLERAAYQREYNKKKRADGKCVRCSEVNDRPGLTYCTVCRAKLKRTTRNSNLRAYGITLEDFERKITEQKNLCALCERVLDGSRGPATVDHDHVTGRIRGIVDRVCNQGLGLLGDNVEGLQAALAYLTRV